ARRVLTFVDSGPDGSGMSIDIDQAVAALQSESMTTTILHLDSEAPEMPVRTGPDANYNRLACESDGYYVYESYPAALEDQLRRLALAYEGVWSAQVEIGADDGGSFTPM